MTIPILRTVKFVEIQYRLKLSPVTINNYDVDSWDLDARLPLTFRAWRSVGELLMSRLEHCP
jgi:hypothetical protein